MAKNERGLHMNSNNKEVGTNVTSEIKETHKVNNEEKSTIKRNFKDDPKSASRKKSNITELANANYSAMGTKELDIDKLKPHPSNERIYGRDEDVSDLIELIRENEDIEKLIVNPQNVIISGHRRWKAARELIKEGKLNLKTVTCEVRKYVSDEAELEALIKLNVGIREKTNEQKTREGIELEKKISERSKERKASSLKQNQTDMGETPTSGDDDTTTEIDLTDEEKGNTRDIVAKAVKISSGTKFVRSKKVVEQADEYRSEGRDLDSEVLIAILNKSPSAAHEFLVVDFSSLSDEDKKDLIDGNVNPRKFIPPKKTTNKSAKLSYSSVSSNFKAIENSTKSLKKFKFTEWDEKENKKVYTKIEEQIKLLQSLLPNDKYESI